MNDRLTAPRYLNIDDAARVSSLSGTTLFRMIGRGELPAFKLGGRTLVDAEALDALIRSRPVVADANS